MIVIKTFQSGTYNCCHTTLLGTTICTSLVCRFTLSSGFNDVRLFGSRFGEAKRAYRRQSKAVCTINLPCFLPPFAFYAKGFYNSNTILHIKTIFTRKLNSIIKIPIQYFQTMISIRFLFLVGQFNVFCLYQTLA